MKRSIALFVGAIIGSLFTACPKQEVPANTMLQIKIQGRVYSDIDKQPVAGAYVGLRYDFITQPPNSEFKQDEFAKSVTDNSGLYSLQCSLDSRPCVGARLYLYPPGSRGVTDSGTPIQCTNNLQTIDLYKK